MLDQIAQQYVNPRYLVLTFARNRMEWGAVGGETWKLDARGGGMDHVNDSDACQTLGVENSVWGGGGGQALGKGWYRIIREIQPEKGEPETGKELTLPRAGQNCNRGEIENKITSVYPHFRDLYINKKSLQNNRAKAYRKSRNYFTLQLRKSECGLNHEVSLFLQ